MRICYKWEWNAHADRMLNIKYSAKLKQYYYFHAEFLEKIWGIYYTCKPIMATSLSFNLPRCTVDSMYMNVCVS